MTVNRWPEGRDRLARGRPGVGPAPRSDRVVKHPLVVNTDEREISKPFLWHCGESVDVIGQLFV